VQLKSFFSLHIQLWIVPKQPHRILLPPLTFYVRLDTRSRLDTLVMCLELLEFLQRPLRSLGKPTLSSETHSIIPSKKTYEYLMPSTAWNTTRSAYVTLSPTSHPVPFFSSTRLKYLSHHQHNSNTLLEEKEKRKHKPEELRDSFPAKLLRTPCRLGFLVFIVESDANRMTFLPHQRSAIC